jgi:hypothetical protein
MAAKSSIVVVALALGLLLVVPCPADAQSESGQGLQEPAASCRSAWAGFRPRP